MSLRDAYLLVCDNCGTCRAYEARRHLPQQILAEAVEHYRWSVFGELMHCADCAPLCASCGQLAEALSDRCSQPSHGPR